MPGMNIGELTSLLQSGDSLEQALESLLPEGERELLKRCAAVHVFDASLFDVLRAAPPSVQDVTLDDLITRGHVERVPGREDLFRLPARLRQEHYARWRADDESGSVVPEALKPLSRELVRYLRDVRGEDHELLYHELVVAPEEALARFEELYRDADERFDLTSCQDLLDVLTERLELIGPQGAVLRNRYRARLRTRSMWLDEWYRSARFLLPARSAAAIDDLMDGGSGRVLMLWGDGGMGKSSHLRWMIARRCALEGNPLAYVDFDDVDAVVAANEPSLLLVEAASQLDQQLPDRPFYELLARYPGQRERLRRRSPALPGSGLDGDIVDRFATALLEASADQRIVLMLDTLEEGILLGGRVRARTDPAPFLRPFSELLARVPALRLLMAGRYDPRRPIPQFRRLFPGARVMQLPPLSDEESRQYLTEYRRLSRPDLVERAVKSAGGVPFKLELIADVAEDHPELDAAELEAYADPDLRYVMDRIVGRLPTGLQWLLRYGVVPRTLDREFARDVLAPSLVQGGGPDLDELWNQLKHYATVASWVSLDPLEKDAVRFHDAVLGPMRELLRRDPAYDDLQRRAAEWFERRAESDAARATQWTLEAIYHRFQLRGPAAERFWRAEIAKARVARRPEARRLLAFDLLKIDYVDENGPRPWRDDGVVIRRNTLLRARWELGVAAAQIAFVPAPERREAEWLEAAQALADIEYLQKGRARQSVTAAELALLRAAIQLGRGAVDEARPNVELAMSGSLTREDRLWLWLAYATASSIAGRADAPAHFRAALGMAGRGERSDAHRTEVYLRLAAHHVANDNLAQARVALNNASDSAEGRLATELRLLRASVELGMGAPSRGLEQLDEVSGDEIGVEARLAIVRMRALLAAGRAGEAVQVGVQAGERLSPELEQGSPRQRALAAEGREIRGKARAMILDADAAARDFEEAAKRWSALGANDSVCRCRVRAAALQLRGMGDLREAAQLLDQARLARPIPGEDAWTRCSLLGAELLSASGRTGRAVSLVDEVIAALGRRQRPPRAVIMAALQGLSLRCASATEDRYLRLLCEELEQISPRSARLVLLDGLSYCPWLSGDPELATRLRRLVPSPRRAPRAYAELGADDLAFMEIRDADVDRVVGRPELARQTLQEIAVAHQDNSLATTMALLEAAVRAEAQDVVSVIATRVLADETLGNAESPTLDAALALEAAAHTDAADQRAELLGRAQTILDHSTPQRNRWTALLWELLGDQSDQAGRQGDARENWGRAAALYDELDDPARREQVLGRGSPDRPKWTAPVNSSEVRVTVRMRPTELSVEALWPDAPPTESILRSPEALIAALRRSGEDLAGPGDPFRALHPLVTDLDELGDQLATVLLAVLDAGPGPQDEGIRHLGLRHKAAALRALPWELATARLEAARFQLFRRAPRARGGPGDVRAIQGALNRLDRAKLSVDGILGPDTRYALRQLQSSVGLPDSGEADADTVAQVQALLTGHGRPRVAIVRPSREAEEMTFRGSRQSGAPVEHMYERAGFDVLVLDGPGEDSLESMLRQRPPAILHLTVGMVEHHGAPAVDLVEAARSKGRATTTGRLTATALERLIPRDLPTPLVIVDVTAPSTRHEASTQLLLRNWFAAEVMALGGVRALIATGLGQYSRRERLYTELIDALGSGSTVGEITRGVQRLGLGGSSLDGLTFSATALFVRTPSVRFPRPAGSSAG